MSNGLNRPSARAQAKSLSERMTTIEENFARVLFGINQRFQGADQRLTTVEEFVDALMDLQGRDEVEALVDEKRLARAHGAADAEKATLDAAVSDGYVTKVEKIGARSIVVGKYLDAAGTVIEPGRAQLVMPGIQPEFRQKLLDQPEGTVLDLPDGGKFVVVEVYEVDEKKALDVQAAKAGAALKIAGEAAASDEATETAGS